MKLILNALVTNKKIFYIIDNTTLLMTNHNLKYDIIYTLAQSNISFSTTLTTNTLYLLYITHKHYNIIISHFKNNYKISQIYIE